MKKLGAAQDRAGRIAVGLVHVEVSDAGALRYQLDREKLRAVRQREGRYLLRTNMTADDPALIWRCYMQLCHVEEESHRKLRLTLVAADCSGLSLIALQYRRCRALGDGTPAVVIPTKGARCPTGR
ncbi:MAG: hypothetical protein PHE83_11320 [Opitutaceae bacterium]|nr:hypothetical protein [Opitutaceae bacterium]